MDKLLASKLENKSKFIKQAYYDLDSKATKLLAKKLKKNNRQIESDIK